MNDAVRLRPVREEDEAFLRRLIASTRAEEPVFSILPPEQHEAFMRMQFNAQRRSYAASFPDASHEIIVDGDEAIGRRYVHRSNKEIRLVDIALLPECRGRGIGSAFIRDLMEEARVAGSVLLLHVRLENHAARRLYESLGFRPGETTELDLLMTWNGRDRRAAGP